MALHLNTFQTFLFCISVLAHFVLQTNTYLLFHELHLRLKIAHFPLSHHLYGTHCLWTLDVVTLFSHLRTCRRLIYITKRIYIDFILLQTIHYMCMLKLYIFVFQCLHLGIVHRLDWWRIINTLLLLSLLHTEVSWLVIFFFFSTGHTLQCPMLFYMLSNINVTR